MKRSLLSDFRRWRWHLRLAYPALVAIGLLLPVSSARAYTSTDPKVQALVSKARQFLASQPGNEMGVAAMMALAMVKSGSDESDPVVQHAVAKIRAGLQDSKKLGAPVNYHVAVSIIALVEINPTQYRSEIQALLDILLSRQEGHGGWSYWPPDESGTHGRDHGDSSQTQYGTLAVWEAKRAGFNVPEEAAARVANFWMRTQAPDGAWGYQGNMFPLGQRGAQQMVRPSLTVAGLSSCYVIGDLFGMSKQKQEQPKDNRPSALQKVQDPKTSSASFSPGAINTDFMRQTMQLGDRNIETNYKGYAKDTWVIYYMYAMERYRSFQEHYTGKVETSPKWYNDGVDFLAEMQNERGYWTFHMFETVDTAFAILFLTRSTKKSIEREYGLGLVRGGRGLPTDIGQIAVDEKTGNLINPELAGTVETLMAILDDPNNANFFTVTAQPEKVIETLVRPKQDEDEVAYEQRIARLKEMVSKGDYQQRLFAVKALARTGDLDKAPLLLYALTDGDPRVRRAADEGLRFLSRKLNGFGDWDDSKPEQLEKVRLQWRDWLLAIRPTAELLE